ncbi:hypothetical protein J437_LFUL006905 [Ladona fulva]|uniref:PR domain zinc finger protein 10 n=1 Tax=Ladona fulva TaxID=123851 RepID=A0A8K0K397_LADFU|nr:hypothetical protein J437_LFUL006905 [Ladona fulva]
MELFPEGELLDIESVELVICDNSENCLADLVGEHDANDLAAVVQREVENVIVGQNGGSGNQPCQTMVDTSSGQNPNIQLPVVVPSTATDVKPTSLGGMASSNVNTPCTAHTVPEKTQGILQNNQFHLSNSVIAEELDAGCDDCDFSYGKECSKHKIQTISDKPVPSRAWATLPAAYLMITKVASESGGKDYGVFARKTIPKRTQFGPVEGVATPKEAAANIHHKIELLLENEQGEFLKLDVSEENTSNWMRFVRPAKSFKEINLILSQQGHSLYFTTTRLIHPREELLVWYSLPYAQRRVVEDAEVNWPCFECNDRFLSSEELQRHLNEHEQGEEIKSSKSRSKGSNKRITTAEYRCQTCNRIFPRNYSLKRHLVLHTGEKKYSCNICGLQFSHPYNKDRHFRKHHKKVEDPPPKKNSDGSKSNSKGAASEWLCVHCSLSFDSPSLLSLHTLAHAAENLEGQFEGDLNKALDEASKMVDTLSYSSPNGRPRKTGPDLENCSLFCPQCGQEFHSKKELVLHASAHGTIRRSRSSLNPAKPHKCELCYKAFASEDRLQKHMLVHGTEESKPLQCEVCSKRFLNNSALACHIKVHTEEKTFECPICREIFYQVLALKEHVHVHCHEGVFTCPHCGKEFHSKKELVLHASAHGTIRRSRSSLNPAKPHKCELCYKAFASEDRLQKHMLVHGTEESKPLQCEVCSKQEKTFECPICREIFYQVLALKEHVHVHCHEGVFTCPHCGKVFDEYSLIRKHIRAFHSERKHKCSFCGKLFPTMDKLKTHMLRHSDHREFLCANCGKQFKRKDKLKEHMKRMHSPEREAKLSAKPARPPNKKKFIPKVSPTDYQRFIYKCHSCLVGFKRRGMLVNHLAKRHPDVSPDTVPELNLPILKTTRDYYCQYCEKVYKSSSKRKAHILKNHPGAELPMSNRKKGGANETLGFPNPTYSQTVGSITTHAHNCTWCHKQYASKPKLLQHQRKKHLDLLPQSQQVPRTMRTDSVDSPMSSLDGKFLSGQDESHVIQMQDGDTITSDVNVAVEYEAAVDEKLREYQEAGIIIDAASLKQSLKHQDQES